MGNKLHFHSLDAFRFFAFFKVFLLHVPITSAVAFPVFGFLKKGGGIGVSFFFVLSGFLISYLLIHEKISTNKVDIKKFFIRRTLRIWPLFFLIIILMFVLPVNIKTLFLGFNEYGYGYDLDWHFSFFFLENYKMYLTDMHPNATTITMFWTLCIEEHFYILWVFAMFFIPKNRILLFLICSVILAIVSRFIEPLVIHNEHIETQEIFTNLDFFAIGGILGYFVAKNFEKVAGFIDSIPFFIRVLTVLIVIAFVVFQSEIYPYHYPSVGNVFRPTVIAILFTCLIAVFIPKDSKLKFSDKNPLSYLGKISYGLYIYHAFVMVGLNKIFIHFNLPLVNWANLSLFMLISFISSVVISSLSYHYFEKPFLRLRERITIKK